MKALTIIEPETMAHALQDEIRRSGEAGCDHRLRAVLLVAQGVKFPEVGRLLGDSIRIVQYWVNQFERGGFAGLADADRLGRPPRLGEQHMETIGKALRQTPTDFGLSANMWDGKTLSALIKGQFDIDLGVRQSQRLFRQLGFRLRKPRPIIAKADPEKQAVHKKTSANCN